MSVFSEDVTIPSWWTELKISKADNLVCVAGTWWLPLSALASEKGLGAFRFLSYLWSPEKVFVGDNFLLLPLLVPGSICISLSGLGSRPPCSLLGFTVALLGFWLCQGLRGQCQGPQVYWKPDCLWWSDSFCDAFCFQEKLRNKLVKAKMSLIW